MSALQKTDRELLKLAAKAAGYCFAWNDHYSCAEIWQPDWKNRQFWSPLIDDGDALRLAVKLEMEIECNAGHTFARALHGIREGVSEFNKTDPSAATRRCIVRAAAQLAESKERE